MPGVSRSGATITGALFLGIDRVTATRMSFFLGIPTLVAAGSFQAVTSASDIAAPGGIGWVATIIGIVVSFFLCGVIAIAGKRGSAPTMVLSRAAFGVNGQKVPGIVSWLTSIGWESYLAILAVLATSSII